MSSSSLLSSQASDQTLLWREYWNAIWYRPVAWSPERVACLLSPERARSDYGKLGTDPLVSDYPRGRRPFLGVHTLSPTGQPSPDSGVLELNDDGHLLTVAPTRSGKGAAHIVPNLLLYAGSCLVIDIKGENYDITAAHRERMFEGARVVRFAPFSPDSDTYNPLDFIRVQEDGAPTDDTFDDARLLAEMLIPTTGKDEFWDVEARNLLTMLLIYVGVRFPPIDRRRNMATVAKLLFRNDIDPADEFAGKGLEKTLEDIEIEARDMQVTILGALLSSFSEHEPKVRSNIASTCRARMMIWLSPNLQRVTAGSSFQFSDLKRSMCRPVEEDPAPTTIYVVIPPEYLIEYRPVLRMMAGLAAVELTRPGDWGDQDGWRPRPPCPVLFLLDEFPSLGHIRPIANGLAYLAGYDVQIWTFVQSIGQLKELYQENWNTFIVNAAAASYFGIADLDLAELLSKQLGDTAEYSHRYETTSTSQSWTTSDSSSDGQTYNWDSGSTNSSGSSSSSSSSDSTSVQEQIRFKRDPVATVADIRSLSPDLQLIFLRNRPPVLATLLPYWQCGLFGKLYGQWRR